MSKDIKKTIRIVTALDDSAFKDLKKQLESLGPVVQNSFKFDPKDIGDIKKAFGDIAKDFGTKLKEALQGVKMPSGAVDASVAGGEESSKGGKSRKSKSKFEEKFDPETGRYFKVKIGQVFDSINKKVFKSPEHQKAYEQAQAKKQLEAFRDSREKDAASEAARAKKAKEEKKTTFDPETGRYFKHKADEIFDPVSKKIFKNETDLTSFKKAQEEKAQKESLRQETASIKKKEQLEQTSIARIFRAFGAEKETAVNAAKIVEGGGMRELGMRGVASAAEGAAGFLGTAGGAALGIGAAVVGAGVVGVNSADRIMAYNRQLRQAQSERDFEQSQSIVGGRALEGEIKESGRNDTSSRVVGGLANTFDTIGSSVKNLVTLNFSDAINDVFNTFSGRAYRTGGLKRTKEEGETRLAEAAPALQALQATKSLRGAKVGLERGGGINGSELNRAMLAGTFEGFSGEQTLHQLGMLKQQLGIGNKKLLPSMQRLENATGVDVGTQIAATSSFMGAEKGTSAEQGMAKTVETLRKGVAAGMDASRAGAFLKTTAEFVTSTQGMGQVNTGNISDSLRDFARSFAGGGPVTDTALNQAKSLAELTRKQSTSMSGLSGVGNVSGVQDFLQKNGLSDNSGLMLNMLNSSENMTEGDFNKMLQQSGVNPKDLKFGYKDFIKGKQQNAQTGTSMLPEDLKTYLLSQENGQTTEQQLNINEATAARGKTPAGQQLGQLPTSEGIKKTSVDFQSLEAEFRVQYQQYVQGLKLLGEETNSVWKNFGKLSGDLEKASQALREFTGRVKRKK